MALTPEETPALVGLGAFPTGLRSRYFGDYEILEEIARGGMGVVYRARQLGINRLVALKMVQSAHLLSDEARLRFRVEIEAVAQLHHPNIVPLYESGEHDGAHYFTMRLLEGGDLAAHFKRERPTRERIRLLVPVCHAVHYAHQHGVLHRDLKPSNILLDDQGVPYVADFGLAKSLDQESGFTLTLSVLGSPNYMAPEQASGRCRQLSTAVDVYGLGAIVYHALAGRPPFQAPTPIETLRQVVDQDPIPPRSFNTQADRDLETIALKCLQKDPAARYGTAEELAHELERWLEGKPILARPVGPIALLWRWCGRHPVAALLSLGLILAIAGIIVSTGIAAVRIGKAERHAAEQLGLARVSETRALRIRGEWANRGEGLRLLREVVPLKLTAETRTQARNELLALLAMPDMQFVGSPAAGRTTDALPTRFEPRFERAASLDRETNVVILAAASGAELARFTSLDGPVARVECFSPDGRFLALRHAEATTVWDITTGQRCWRQIGTNVVFCFGSRAGQLVVQESPNEAVFLELPAGRETRRWKVEPGRPGGRAGGWHTLVLSPDGRILAGASAVSQIVEWLDAQTGHALRLLTNSPRTTAMGWSRDGRRFAVATGGGRTYVWDTARGGLLWTSQSLPGRAHSLAFHPHDALLALACEDERIRIIDLNEFRTVFEAIAESPQLSYSPDGRRLGPARVGGRVGWFETTLSGEYMEFDAGVPSERSSDGRFSADGRLLAVGHPLAVALCDPATGSVLHRLRDWRMSAFAFHPQENFLLAGHTRGLLRLDARESIKATLAATNGVILDPAQRWRAIDFSRDGRWMAAFNGRSNTAVVFDHTLTNRVAAFGPHREAEDIAISPGGRWVATGSYADKSVRIWDVPSQTLALTLAVGPRPQTAFSDDGKWLATFGGTFGLREIGSWKPAPPLRALEGPVVFGAAAFSPDSRLLAVVGNLNPVHLFDLQSLEPIGILRPSGAIRIRALVFSPDGSRLAGVGSEGRVAVWHLSRMRDRLAEIGLDWTEPPPRTARR